MFRPLMLIAPLVLATGLAACDGEDYEARVVELEGELETVRGESQELRTQLEESRTRITEFEQAQGQAGTADPEALREPIRTALAALAQSDERLDVLSSAAANQAEMDPQAVQQARDAVERAAEAIGEAAQAAGIELDSVAPEVPSAQPRQ